MSRFKLALAGLLALALTPISVAQPPSVTPQAPELAFPGAVGWAATTGGGRGGQVIRVTNLNGEGPGSFRAAMETAGPRIIVFEVGGVIDLNRRTLRLTEPFVTIAGQTAPSPGITFIRGGMDIATHDVIVQHIRIRPGSAEQARGSGWDEDAISTQSAYNVIVDHCSLTWATDENLSASGPRFTGSTPEEWRAGTSHRITFSHNLLAEGLADSTHAKFEHSKGSLIHDNVADILIYANVYAHNYERSPMFKGGVHGAIINNLIYDPGQRALHYNLMAEEWGAVPFQNGQMVAVGNVLRAGPSTPSPLAFLMIGGYGDLEFFGRDNIAVDRIGEPLPMFGRYTTSSARIIQLRRAPFWPEGLTAMPAENVQRYTLANAGARPWDRDGHDVRIIANVAEGRGEIIDNEARVGGYPHPAPTRHAFNPEDWNLHDMTPRRPDVLDSGARARGT
ncbi:pectate lyase [alpha proteobacterium U9-1i]|nr:pectate lyase [alpha proteobacterium U9-1i]